MCRPSPTSSAVSRPSPWIAWLFLAETWPLHPSICDLTSEVFYAGKLKPKAGLERQVIKGSVSGSGLRYLPVDHTGNQNCSPEEAVAISDFVQSMLASDTTWVDADGEEKPLTLHDIMVITPYNAQVFEIQQRLPGARVGTVDKFQGQEAAVASTPPQRQAMPMRHAAWSSCTA